MAVAAGTKGDTYYGRRARNYEVRRSRQDWWHVEQEAMQALLAKLPDGLSVVDIPFGTGRFVNFYREKNFSIAGLDASSDMIAQAKEILGDTMTGVDARVGISTELPFENGEFDLLVSTRFLRDIIPFRDAEKSLEEFARVTKSFAIIQLGITTNARGRTPKPNEPMGSDLSLRQVTNLLDAVGFKIEDQKLVKEDPNDNSEIYHFFCKKT